MALNNTSCYCMKEGELHDGGKRLVFVSVSIVSSTIGLIGAAVLIVSYFPETRRFVKKQNLSGSRHAMQLNPLIIFLLACTNLISCAGVIARSVNLQLTSLKTTTQYQCTQFDSRQKTEVVLQSITEFSFIASVMWTLSFAVNIFYQLRGKQVSMLWFHCLSWTVPTLCTTVGTTLACVGSDEPGHRDTLVWRYIVFYTPMLVTSVICCILYWRSARAVSEVFTKLTATLSFQERTVTRRLHVRFFWIVFTFGLCWFPNILNSVVCLVFLYVHCKSCQNTVLFPFWILEALFNPLQGLFNCFLYGYKCRPCMYKGRTRRHNMDHSARNYIPITDDSDSV